MRTTTIAAVLIGLLGLASTAGCNKPSESECRGAIANMRRLLETDKQNVSGDLEAAVRRCRGSSNKKSVLCATQAQSVEQLDACGLLPPQPASKTETTPAVEPAPAPAPQAAAGAPSDVAPQPAPDPTAAAPSAPSAPIVPSEPVAEPAAPSTPPPAPEPATK